MHQHLVEKKNCFCCKYLREKIDVLAIFGFPRKQGRSNYRCYQMEKIKNKKHKIDAKATPLNPVAFHFCNSIRITFFFLKISRTQT